MEIIRRQPVAEAATAGVQLDIQRPGTDVALQLDEVIASS
jgi:hypothetical protein